MLEICSKKGTSAFVKIRQSKEYNIGRTIREYRMNAGLTQEQVVAKMQLMGVDISRGTYSQIECGISNIRVEELLALTKIFKCEVGCFFKDVSL